MKDQPNFQAIEKANHCGSIFTLHTPLNLVLLSEFDTQFLLGFSLSPNSKPHALNNYRREIDRKQRQK